MTDINQKDLELLQRALEFEKSVDPDIYTLGWRWYDVNAYTATITKLVIRQLVRISFKSHSETRYQLTDMGKFAAEGVSMAPEGATILGASVGRAPGIEVDTADMFSDITGYDDIKELLHESLQLSKPIHVLLVGPPSLAKSMFLWDIERAYGDLSLPLIGSATSHAGLWDMIAEKRPKIVLVDEIEKMALADMAALLAMMEQGRIIRAKVGRKLDEKLTVWVIAAANRTAKMPMELLSRFAIHQLEEYGATEFRHVVTSVLETREDTNHDTAAEIATRLLGRTHDVRDAVRVARLAKRTGVVRAVELLIR